MKKNYLLLLLLPFWGCIDRGNGLADVSTDYSPVLMYEKDLANGVKYKTGYQLEAAGKIYTYGTTILMAERYNGIHIIDNSDPVNPVNTGFIAIPGCVDIAVKENILYADNATDLIAIDLDKLPEVEVLKRIAGVFPDLLPPDANTMPYEYTAENRPDGTVIIGWNLLD